MEQSSDASVTQLVEYHVANVTVDGSNPFTRSIFFALIPDFQHNILIYAHYILQNLLIAEAWLHHALLTVRELQNIA